MSESQSETGDIAPRSTLSTNFASASGSCVRGISIHALTYLAVVAVTISVLVCVLQLWEADFDVPFSNEGDSLCAQAWIKSVQENGWFLHNPSLGAPWGSDLYDFPLADDVHFMAIRLLAPLVTTPARLFNVYFLLQFPLIACAAFAVLRRLGIHSALALVASILFAFLPFHLFRGRSHIFLASYYLVPFQILLAIRLGQGPERETRRPAWRRVMDFFALLLLCFLVAGAGIYYAFFGSILFLLAGLHALLQGRGWTSLAKAVLLCLFTCVAVLVHLFPQISYVYEHGVNRDALQRAPSEAEVLGLKLAHLLLPINGHRSEVFRELKSRYLAKGVLNNENGDSSLGLLGSAAFVLLLAHLLRRKESSPDPHRSTLDVLAMLNLGAILIGTIGGFGVLFSLLVTSWIRAYNRISVFIAFFAFAGAALALDPIIRRLANLRFGMIGIVFGLFTVLAFGIWDQTSPNMAPDYQALAANHASDLNFVRELESDLTPGALVFQIPYIAYPEAMSFGACRSYDHLKPYLISNSLRWSFGAFRGGPADSFVHMLSSMQPERMLRSLVLVGYEGLLIDRYGYADRGKRLEHELDGLLCDSPTISADGRWVFYPLDGFKRELRTLISDGHWQQAKRDLASPILPLFGRGFLSEEGAPDATFRWCGSDGELRLVNVETQARMVEVEFEADRLSAEPTHLDVAFPDGNESFLVGYGEQHFHLRLRAESGFTTLRFACDGKPVDDPNEHRELVFRLKSFTVLPESVP
jgi:phosphoglycerol transferase